jgi:hypothetical protein
MSNNQTAKHYLNDIQGTLPFPDFDELIKTEGLLGILPENIQKYSDEIDKAEDDGVHQYLCNIDKAPSSCNVNKAIAARDKGRLVGYVQWDTNKPLKLLYSVDGHLVERDVANKQKVKPIPLAKTRAGLSKTQRGNNLGRTVLGQGLANKPTGTFLTRSVNPNRKGDNRQLFRDAVEGKGNLSIGDRAVLFNQDGSVTTGANNIRDNAVANERSSNIPSESVNNGSIPKKVKSATPYKTSQHPNKSRLAKTNDLAGGVAALGGVAAMVGIIALLMPQHFVTSAITFLTSITTFFTNVNNAVNTYLTVVDALLGIFGIKGSGKAVKGFIAQIVDNALGKENVREIKNAFASGINTIAVTTKLLEKTQAMANNTDNLVDGVALKLGAVNNAMGEAGLIPPELMATSASIDTLVEKRTKDNEDLADNLTALTAEIKDKEETTKELKDEKETREKLEAKKAKDLDDVKGLLDGVKTDTAKIDINAL